MTPLKAYIRYLQEAKPTTRNMWKLYDRTAQNLEFRGVTLRDNEWSELENAYQAYLIEGTPMEDYGNGE